MEGKWRVNGGYTARCPLLCRHWHKRQQYGWRRCRRARDLGTIPGAQSARMRVSAADLDRTLECLAADHQSVYASRVVRSGHSFGTDSFIQSLERSLHRNPGVCMRVCARPQVPVRSPFRRLELAWSIWCPTPRTGAFTLGIMSP
jgi:hypothetical protein